MFRGFRVGVKGSAGLGVWSLPVPGEQQKILEKYHRADALSSFTASEAHSKQFSINKRHGG